MAATSRPPDRPRPDLPDQYDSRHLLRRLAGFAIVLAVVAIAIVSLPGLGELRNRFAHADARLLIAIALLSLFQFRAFRSKD